MLRSSIIAAVAFLAILSSCKTPDPAKQAEQAAQTKALIDSSFETLLSELDKL